MVKTGISLDSVKNNNKSQILKITAEKRRNVKEGILPIQIGLTPAAVTMLCNDNDGSSHDNLKRVR